MKSVNITLEQKQKTPKENMQQRKKHVLYLPFEDTVR